jgi:hypothetical protein
VEESNVEEDSEEEDNVEEDSVQEDTGDEIRHWDDVWYYTPDIHVARPKMGSRELEAIV